MAKKEKNRGYLTGIVAVVFLVIGYQTALFIHQSAVMKITACRDEPDTIYVLRDLSEAEQPATEESLVSIRRNAGHSLRAQNVRNNAPRRRIETFRFNPNTVSEEDLCRLGFSPKQARSIAAYREKGGKFRRPSDFARSYVVADSVYKRLEPYIDIPFVDLNLADSADFDALPGIGGWYASRMVEYREELRGYSYKEQLMDIWKFDREKFDALSDLITVSLENVRPYPLWSLPADSLRLHPYIGNYETARAIVLFRENNPDDLWTVDALQRAGILTDDSASRLSGCVIDLK